MWGYLIILPVLAYFLLVLKRKVRRPAFLTYNRMLGIASTLYIIASYPIFHKAYVVFQEKRSEQAIVELK